MSTEKPALNPSFPGLFGLLGRGWWVLLVYGLLAVVFGVLALLRPVDAASALVWAFGVLALAEGVVTLFALFGKDVLVPKGWLALYALASIAFGVVAVLFPLVVASVVLLFVAAWLIVGGVYRIVFAIRVRKQIQGEWLIVVSGVLGIALGVLFAINPVAGVAVTTLWIGVLALFYGVFQIVAAFRLRKFRSP